jgi:hypothetical protein
VTFSLGDITVTTWGRNDAGQQVWRAYHDDMHAEFVAPRDSDIPTLAAKAREALGLEPKGEHE